MIILKLIIDREKNSLIFWRLLRTVQKLQELYEFVLCSHINNFGISAEWVFLQQAIANIPFWNWRSS